MLEQLKLSGTPPDGNNINITLTCNDGAGGVVQKIFTIVVADAFVVDAGGGGDFLLIQDAIDASISGDVIYVQNGTYNENINYNGKEIEIYSASGDPTLAIIDGGGTGSVVTIANGEAGITTLNGFTIRNGGGNFGCSSSFFTLCPFIRILWWWNLLLSI